MPGMSVGEVAGRLGVSASTVRMWGRRYGLAASDRSPGGHRRYTAEDFQRLARMQELVGTGTDPARAAAAVLSVGEVPAPPARGARGGPGGAVLAVPGADARVRGLARAAGRLQEGVVTTALLQALRSDGASATWSDLVVPLLVAAGEHWHHRGAGIEIEHLLTQSVSTAFSAYGAEMTKIAQQDSPVILAAGPEDDHVLTLHALRAVLLERGVGVRFLGARTPCEALTATARLTRAPAVFVWATMPARVGVDELTALAGVHRRLALVLGGPGWDALAPDAPGRRSTGLEEAADLLESAWRAR